MIFRSCRCSRRRPEHPYPRSVRIATSGRPVRTAIGRHSRDDRTVSADRRHPKFNSLKKSLPLSSMTMKAGKSTTSMRQIASMPSSGYSSALDLLDAMLGEVRRGAADRGEIEAAVLLAGVAHHGRAVALRQHHHRAAGGLEILDEGIHAPGRGRPERARGIAFRRLRRARVIDRMVLEIIRQSLPLLQPLAQLGMRQIARHDHRTGERQPRLDRIFRELRQDFLHRLGEIDLHHLAAELCRIDIRQIFRRIVLELFEEHAVLGDLAERLAVGRARHAKPDRQRGAVARQPDHAHVVAEIFAAELRADAERLRHLQNLAAPSPCRGRRGRPRSRGRAACRNIWWRRA